MSKKIIFSDNAPAAIGPYSHAVEANGMLFVSGQVPFVPETGEIAAGGIIEQTKQSLANIDAILKEANRYGLVTEVRSTAIAFMLEDPTLDSGSAYIMAGQEWDIW